MGPVGSLKIKNMKTFTIKPNGIFRGLAVNKDPIPHLNLGKLIFDKSIEIRLPADINDAAFYGYDLDEENQGCVFEVKIERPEDDTVKLVVQSYYIMKNGESYLVTLVTAEKSKEKTAIILVDVPPKSGGHNQYSIARRIGREKISEFENLDTENSLASIIEIGKTPFGEKILFSIEPDTLIKIVRIGKKDDGPESILFYWNGYITSTSLENQQEPDIKALLVIADETHIRTEASKALSCKN